MKQKNKVKFSLLLTIALLAGCTPEKPPVIIPAKGYEVLENWVTIADFDTSYLRGDDTSDILVLPISVPKEKRDISVLAKEWDNKTIKAVTDYYTDPNCDEQYAVIPYFERASFGKKTFNNYVAPLYIENDYLLSDIENPNLYYSCLIQLINKAIKNAEINYGDGFKERFDKNNDGFVDALNVMLDTHDSKNGVDVVTWPHSADAMVENGNYLGVGRYTLTNSVYFSRDTTVINHELSHTFGIADYYDYGYSGRSFIGGYDMQEDNAGDWNAFSKFTVGWGTPYVINGEKDEVTITIASSQLTGEYIVIPSDYYFFEDSPFNEYFILELITNDENNKGALEKYIDHEGESYGARLMYANGTLCKIKTSSIVGAKSEGTLKTFEDAEALKDDANSFSMYACNNSVPSSTRPYVKGYDNVPLLSVVEASKENRFWTTKDWSQISLQEEDLFYTDDEFVFQDYSTFITKDLLSQEYMNDGSYFPYKIHFDEVNKDYMTVTITYEY